MTLALHGSPISNYYNKVKLALLEKGVPFVEVPTGTGRRDDEVLSASPLGKIPYLKLEDGRTLCESQVILEWLEATHPQVPLLPADPFAAAKVRELCTFVDWHVEMGVRQLYGMAFFGQPALSDANLARIRREVEGKIDGLKRLLRLAPFAAGDKFTLADCSAYPTLPLVGRTTKVVYGEDLLLAAGVDYKPYMQLISDRPAGGQVEADRRAAVKPRA